MKTIQILEVPPKDPTPIRTHIRNYGRLYRRAAWIFLGLGLVGFEWGRQDEYKAMQFSGVLLPRPH